MANLQIIDTHAHLDMEQFNQDRDEVIQRARAVGVALINTVGIDCDSSQKAIELAERYECVLASVGIHPQEAHRAKEDDYEKLLTLAKHPRVVAVGETGLDFYRSRDTTVAQQRILGWHLKIARELNLPVIIHCRQAQEEIKPVIDEWALESSVDNNNARGVLHCFSGDEKLANWYLDRGFYISVGAYIGYPSSVALRNTLSNIPIDRILIETDCPFLPPQQYRGKRNEPAYTVFTVNTLAQIKKTTPEQLARQTSQNAIILFNLTGKTAWNGTD